MNVRKHMLQGKARKARKLLLQAEALLDASRANRAVMEDEMRLLAARKEEISGSRISRKGRCRDRGFPEKAGAEIAELDGDIGDLAAKIEKCRLGEESMERQIQTVKAERDALG